MFKVMVMLKRKPGLSLQDFIDYYENNHAPLGVKYQTKMKRYIRHYLHAAPYPLDGTIVEAEYDVLTEIWFDDRAAFDEGTALMMAPEAQKVLAEDEKRFVDTTKNRTAFIEEHETEFPAKAGKDEKSIKCYVLLKRKPELTVDEFIDYYENKHAPLGVKYSAVAMSGYKRIFFRPAPYMLDGTVREPAYDVATEVTFANQEDMVLAKNLMTDPEINAIIEADEANFLDRNTRNFMFVKDRESVLP